MWNHCSAARDWRVWGLLLLLKALTLVLPAYVHMGSGMADTISRKAREENTSTWLKPPTHTRVKLYRITLFGDLLLGGQGQWQISLDSESSVFFPLPRLSVTRVSARSCQLLSVGNLLHHDPHDGNPWTAVPGFTMSLGTHPCDFLGSILIVTAFPSLLTRGLKI